MEDSYHEKLDTIRRRHEKEVLYLTDGYNTQIQQLEKKVENVSHKQLITAFFSLPQKKKEN